jgi:hypothetical protein
MLFQPSLSSLSASGVPLSQQQLSVRASSPPNPRQKSRLRRAQHWAPTAARPALPTHLWCQNKNLNAFSTIFRTGTLSPAQAVACGGLRFSQRYLRPNGCPCCTGDPYHAGLASPAWLPVLAPVCYTVLYNKTYPLCTCKHPQTADPAPRHCAIHGSDGTA